MYPLEWTDFVRDKLKGKPEHWNADNKGHVAALKRRYMEDHPELLSKVSDDTMLVIDAKHMVADPHRDRALQGHKGLHPTTMQTTAERLHESQLSFMADYMVWWTESFIGEDKPTIEKDLLIITVCNKERHRSVASKELILQSLKRCKQEIRCEVIRVGGEMPHWSKLCPNTCPDCSWDGKERKDLIGKLKKLIRSRKTRVRMHLGGMME